MKGGADVALKGPKGRTAADIARLRYGNAAAARRKGADIALLALLGGKSYAQATASPEAMEAVLALTRRERKMIQSGLKAAGSDPGPADGAFGPATRKAVKAWQKKKGEAATGWLTPAGAKTLAALGEKKKRAEERRAEAERRNIERKRNARKKELAELTGFIRKSLHDCGTFKYSDMHDLLNSRYEKVRPSGATIDFSRSHSGQYNGRVGGIRYTAKAYGRHSGRIALDKVKYVSYGSNKSSHILKYYGGGYINNWYVHFSGPKELVYEDSHISRTSMPLNGRRAGIWDTPRKFGNRSTGSAWLYVCNEKTASAIHSRVKGFLEKRKDGAQK